MARPPNEDRSTIRDASITIRLTPEKKEALERLADEQKIEAQRLLGSGVQFSVGHMLIKWIDDALAARAAREAPSAAPPVIVAPAPVPPPAAPVELPAAPATAPRAAKPAPPTPPKAADDEQSAVRNRLKAALDAKAFSQGWIAKEAGWQQSSVSEFCRGKPCTEKRLPLMAAALTRHGR